MLKNKHKQLKRRLLSLITALSLSASFLILPATTSLTAHAGLVTNVITGKWGAIALGTIERGVIFGVSKAKSAVEEDGVYQALRWTQRILAGNSGLVASDTLAAVKQIQAELHALVAFTSQSSGEIENMLYDIEKMELKQNFSNYYTTVKNFGSNYNTMLADFNDFFDAFADYADERETNPGADTSALRTAYLTLVDKYHSQNTSSLFEAPLMGEAENRTGFLSTISPYDKTVKIETSQDVYDPAKWGSASGILAGDTYLEAYYEYITHVTNFESNVYNQMRAAANFAADAVYKYVQAYRYYVEFESMLISADASDPASASNKIQLLWGKFFDCSNKAQRGINQMLSLHSEVFDTFMRGYDVDATVTIKNHQTEQLLYNAFSGYVNENGGKKSAYDTIEWDDGTNANNSGKCIFYTDYKLPAQKVKKADQKVYQFKLASEQGNKAYAIRQTGNGNDKFTCYDATWSAKSDAGLYSTVVSLDALNLLKNTTSGYVAPKSTAEFSAITSLNNPVYKQDGLMTDYIRNELVFSGIKSPSLPTLTKTGDSAANAKDGPNFFLLKTPIYWNEEHAASNWLSYHDMHTTYANASMHSMPSTGLIDIEECLREPAEDGALANKDMLVMYSGTPKVWVELQNGKNGSTYLTYTNLSDYLNGKKATKHFSGTNLITCCDIADLAFKPDDGKTVTCIQLQDKNGKVLEDLLSDHTVYYDPNASISDVSSDSIHPTESYTVYAQEQFEDFIPDSDGYRHVIFPVPYQDCKIVVSYSDADSSLLTYSCTTHDQTENNQTRIVMQYGGYDYLAERDFHAGETVDIIATGYNGSIANGIYINDKNGSRLNIPVTDTSESAVRVSPTERSYSFVMPDQDIDVYPTAEASYDVTVYDQNSTHSFEIAKCYDFINLKDINSWQTADTVPFATGGSVRINIKANNGYFLKNISVVDNDNRVNVPCTVTEEGIVFEMPAGNVSVHVETEPIDISRYTATISSGSTQCLNFLDGSGNPLNVSSLQVSAGEEVRLLLGPDDPCRKVILVQNSAGEPVETATSDGTTYSFQMPGDNVTISAEHTDEPSHKYVNGICARCGEYEPAVQNSDGYYRLGNAGNFLWYAALVNDEHEHAEFEERDAFANAVLVDDIDLENRPFTNIGKFTSGAVAATEDRYGGYFDGQGHTIENFYADGSYNHWGMFGMTYCRISHLTVKGKIDVTADAPGKDAMLGLVCYGGTGSKLTDVTSCLEINDNGKDIELIGGIAAFVMSGGTIERCIFRGTINSSSQKLSSAGGIIGDSGAGNTIKDCANLGTIRCSTGKAAGIAPVIEAGKSTVADVYNYGSVSASSDQKAGAVTVSAPTKTTVENGYYLDGASPAGAFEDKLTKETAEQFRSGRVGFKLNHGISDGTQVWYQNIDNGKTPDDYPLPDKTRGTIYYIASKDGYSNYPDDNPPPSAKVTVSIDTEKFILDENGTPTSYLVFDSTGTSAPVSVDPDTDVLLRYVTDDDYLLDAVLSEDPASGEKETLDFGDGSILCHVGEKDLTIVPSFVKKSQPEPEPGKVYGIRTYDELTAFAEHVRDDYDRYGKAEVWLENHIIAPEDSQWTRGIGSVEKPFMGTFDGRGYAIIGLNISNPAYGALFECIGRDGTVKDLAVIDCQFDTASGKISTYAGGIAAVNEGLIDHCISGINTSSDRLIKTLSGKSRSLSSFNSVVYGTYCGGIAAHNTGTIKGSRNSAYVLGADGGGIAAVNDGTIYGCANNGPVGNNSVTVKRCSGIAVVNNGTIEASYNSGKMNGTSKTVLTSISAENNSSKLKNVYYCTAYKTLPVGEDSAYQPDSTCHELPIDKMASSDFAKTLNTVTDDSVSWKQAVYSTTKLNQGLPVVSGRFMETVTLSDSAVLKLRASMHKSMSLRYTPVDPLSDAYQALLSAAGTNALTCAYDLTAADTSGRELPAELWCEGITVSVPVSSEDVLFITLNEQGEAVTVAPDSVENGWATLTMAEPTAFAAVEKASSDTPVPTPANRDNVSVNTGDSSLTLTAAFSLMLASALAVLIIRRKKERDESDE